jgi:hypothetical protein
MNTLDDLRNTLDQHAEGLADTEHHVRPVAVRARVRAVRRRRAAAAAVSVVVVVLAAVAGAAVLREPSEIQPADPTVAGVDVPKTIEVVGFPYELRQLHSLSDDHLALTATGSERAVLLAASGLGSGSATLYSDDVPVARVRGDQQVAAPVALGDGAPDLRVRFDGTEAEARAGVALYETTGRLADGTDNGEAVFRDEVAGNPLLDAGFAEPGQRAVLLQAGGRLDALRVVMYCDGSQDLWIHVAIDGEDAISSGCGDRGRDAGAGSSGTLDDWGAGDHRFRIYLTRGADGPEITADGATFGAGIYALPTTDREILGIRVASRVEYDGRTWALDDVTTAPASVDTADGDVLLGVVTRDSHPRVSWTGALDRGSEDSVYGNRGGSALALGGVLLAGDRYDVKAVGEGTRLLLYRPL